MEQRRYRIQIFNHFSANKTLFLWKNYLNYSFKNKTIYIVLEIITYYY